MTPTRPFSCILLAGGKSSRMGQDKAELNWHGQPLWQHMRTLAVAAGASKVVISRNVPGFVPDRYPETGPLAGIEAGLRYCQHPRVLVLAIDTPLLTAAALQQLLAVESHQAVCFSGHALPCVLPNGIQLQRYLQQVLTQPDTDRSVKTLLSNLGCTQLTPTHPATLSNVNTEAQWQQALSSVSKELQHG